MVEKLNVWLKGKCAWLEMKMFMIEKKMCTVEKKMLKIAGYLQSTYRSVSGFSYWSCYEGFGFGYS